MKEDCSDDLRIKPLFLPEMGDVFDLFIDPNPKQDMQAGWRSINVDMCKSSDNLTHTIIFKLEAAADPSSLLAEINDSHVCVEGVFGKLLNGVIDESKETIIFEWEPETPEDNIHEDWNIAT